MPYDLQLFHALNGLAGNSAGGDALILFFATYLPYLLVAGFALFLVVRRTQSITSRIAWFLLATLAALIARLGVAELIRFFIHRDRPFVSMDVHQLILLSSQSFPSGHAIYFFAFSTIVYYYHRKLGVLFLILSGSICLARVAAGVHYPSDVLVGAVLGSLVGLVVHRYFLKFLKLVGN